MMQTALQKQILEKKCQKKDNKEDDNIFLKHLIDDKNCYEKLEQEKKFKKWQLNRSIDEHRLNVIAEHKYKVNKFAKEERQFDNDYLKKAKIAEEDELNHNILKKEKEIGMKLVKLNY